MVFQALHRMKQWVVMTDDEDERLYDHHVLCWLHDGPEIETAIWMGQLPHSRMMDYLSRMVISFTR